MDHEQFLRFCSMKRYQAGIVGLGRIASLYEEDRLARHFYPSLTHAGTYRRHSRTTLVAGCDPNPIRRQKFSQRWKVPSVYKTVSEMLDNHSLDLLSVCAPPDAHLSVIRGAAGRVPMIFCEKPLGQNSLEAEEIVALCTRKKTKLAVNAYRLFDPSHREVGRRIGQGEIGSIQRVNCFYGKGLRNMGSHLVSLLLSYFGPVDWVQTLAYRSLGDTAEPTADFVIKFRGGVPAFVQGCDFRNYRIFEVDVLGSKGRLTLEREGFGFRFLRAVAHRAETGARELRSSGTHLRSTVGKALHWAIQNLVESLDRRVEPFGSGREYLATEKVLEAVRQSARRGHRINLI
jgi:predicted dehydrogenase